MRRGIRADKDVLPAMSDMAGVPRFNEGEPIAALRAGLCGLNHSHAVVESADEIQQRNAKR